MSLGGLITNDMGMIHSGHPKQRKSKGIVVDTEKSLRFQATHAAQDWLLKLMLIKTIYTTCNYFRADSAGDCSNK